MSWVVLCLISFTFVFSVVKARRRQVYGELVFLHCIASAVLYFFLLFRAVLFLNSSFWVLDISLAELRGKLLSKGEGRGGRKEKQKILAKISVYRAEQRPCVRWLRLGSCADVFVFAECYSFMCKASQIFESTALRNLLLHRLRRLLLFCVQFVGYHGICHHDYQFTL